MFTNVVRITADRCSKNLINMEQQTKQSLYKSVSSVMEFFLWSSQFWKMPKSEFFHKVTTKGLKFTSGQSFVSPINMFCISNSNVDNKNFEE